MFYRCPNCKKTWQYPAEKCPDCFLKLERIKSQKAKVIGVSKVNIPTLFHPKVPYFVLLLEDYNPPKDGSSRFAGSSRVPTTQGAQTKVWEGGEYGSSRVGVPSEGRAPEKGNRWAQKSVREYKIGEEFRFEGEKNENAVAVWRIKYDILEGIEKVIELLGGLEIDSKIKILILPTLVSPRHPYFAENTNPQFLESLISYLFEGGGKPENIKVVAQSFDETPIETSAQKSQLLEVCLKNQITPSDLSKTNFLKKNGFEVSEELFSSDIDINLPILKVGKASATENLFKFIKKESYLGLKYLSSKKDIAKNLITLLPKILTIGEAHVVQKPDGYTTFLGLVLSSFNPLNLDRVFAEICMVPCQKFGGGELPECLKDVKIESIPILGRQIEELQYDVERF